jgi:hypothetical protein
MKVKANKSAEIVILPVIRIERHSDESAMWAASRGHRRRRRRAPAPLAPMTG